MEPVIHPHQIESGRIFINFYNRNEFIIKCFYCCQSFGQWVHFIGHVQSQHSDLKRSHSQAKAVWKAFDQRNGASLAEDDFELKCIAEEAYEDWKLAEETESEEEFADEVTNLEFAEVDESEDTCSMSSPYTTQKAIDALTDDDASSYSLSEEATERKPNKRRFRYAEDTHEDSEDEPPIKLKAADPDPRNHEDEVGNTTCKRIFYNLRCTPAEIMLGFIELIRQHPCHWDPDDEDYDFRDKRNASAEEISLELKKRWGIKTSPQLARTSVLQLCRWFEREYLRSISQPKNSKPFVSSHQDYYTALFSFLPHNHLKVACCDSCPRLFKTEALLAAHKCKYHNGEMPFRCQYCGRGYRHPSTLRNHEYRHTKTNLWKCGLCNYECAMKTDIRVHMAAHSEERAFVCEVCGGAYKSSTSLNVHRRTHKPPNLECQQCGKKFYENCRLKRHILNHHNGKGKSTDVRCDICLRKFTSVLRMQNHRRHKHAFLVNSDEGEDEIDT